MQIHYEYQKNVFAISGMRMLGYPANTGHIKMCMIEVYAGATVMWI